MVDFTQTATNPIHQLEVILESPEEHPPQGDRSSNQVTRSIMVVHAGRRDNYEVAKALEGDNTFLVTDFFYQPDRLSGKLARILFGNRIYKRYRRDLKVHVRGSLLLFTLDILEQGFPRNTVTTPLRPPA